MRVLLFMITFFFLFLSDVTIGQNFAIYGNIKDTSNSKMEFVTVALFKDSVYINSVISDSTGFYNFKELNVGNNKIAFSYIGFLKYDTIIVVNQNIRFDCILFNETKSLNQIIVRFRKPTIERKGDRLVFNIENSIFNAGLDALETIAKSPGVRVQNNTISLVGKSKVSIMVDDKIIQMTGDDLSAYLKSIASEDISKIEIITNPSSKYDAEGKSGLINIVTKKIRKQGFNSNFRFSGYKATFYSYNSGVTTNYYKKKLKLLASFGISEGRSEEHTSELQSL